MDYIARDKELAMKAFSRVMVVSSANVAIPWTEVYKAESKLGFARRMREYLHVCEGHEAYFQYERLVGKFDSIEPLKWLLCALENIDVDVYLLASSANESSARDDLWAAFQNIYHFWDMAHMSCKDDGYIIQIDDRRCRYASPFDFVRLYPDSSIFILIERNLHYCTCKGTASPDLVRKLGEYCSGRTRRKISEWLIDDQDAPSSLMVNYGLAWQGLNNEQKWYDTVDYFFGDKLAQPLHALLKVPVVEKVFLDKNKRGLHALHQIVWDEEA